MSEQRINFYDIKYTDNKGKRGIKREYIYERAIKTRNTLQQNGYKNVAIVPCSV